MKKKVLTTVTLLFLYSLTTFFPTAAYAVPCQVKDDCSFGQTCSPTDRGQKECISVPPGNFCQGDNNRCGRGFTCVREEGGSVCRSSVGGVTTPGTGEGVEIGPSFFNNFISFPASLGAFIAGLMTQIYVIALIFVLIYLVWGAYRYMISAGDPKAAKGARDHMTYAVMGMVLIFLAYGIFQLLNTSIFNKAFGT